MQVETNSEIRSDLTTVVLSSQTTRKGSRDAGLCGHRPGIGEMKLNPNVANANGKDLSTAYDNIEVYMNSLVKNIIQNQAE
jgi:hypothetical protein